MGEDEKMGVLTNLADINPSSSEIKAYYTKQLECMAATGKSIPCLDLTSNPKTLERGSEEWKAMSQRVCEALETHGCLTVEYNKIDLEEIVKAMRSFFDLPLETRAKPHGASTSVRMDENGTSAVYENLQVHNDVVKPDRAKAFTDTMWPQGNQAFCETVITTSKKMLELSETVMDMICDCFELKPDDESPTALIENTRFHMLRYAAPMKDEIQTGAQEHIDPTTLSILCQNEVEGLLVKSMQHQQKQSKSHHLLDSPHAGGSLIVFAGAALRAWTNGQFQSAPHKVEYSGYKDRLSCGLFLSPKWDAIVQAHPKFINEQRPPLFKPFIQGEFFRYMAKLYFSSHGLDSHARLDATNTPTEA